MGDRKKKRLLDVGPGFTLRLPDDVVEALGLEKGEKVEVFLDTRRKAVRFERHVEDPWAEALKPKREKDFDDLLAEQSDREAAANDIFEQNLKKKPPEKRPEDDPDHWR